MSWPLSLWKGTCDTGQQIPCFDPNMDVCYQVKHKLLAPNLARKFDISHWFACGADERKVTWLPKFLGWLHH